jgi:hypothetical protein
VAKSGRNALVSDARKARSLVAVYRHLAEASYCWYRLSDNKEDEDVVGYESDTSCFFLALQVPPNVSSHQTRLDSLRGTFSWFRMTPCSAILRFHTAETMSSLSIFQSNPIIYDRGRCSKTMNRFAVRVKCCENCKVHLICSLLLQFNAKHLVPVHLQIDQSEFKSKPHIPE